jgi:tetratricopeptide (TPR) repeat protein
MKANNALLILLPLLITGCASNLNNLVEVKKPNEQIYKNYLIHSDKPKELQNLYINRNLEDSKNLVKQDMQLGLYLFDKQYYDHSEMMLDNVLLNIESIYSDTEDAEKARSLWYAESEKKFIGEPYERAMAYLYRGLIYIYKNDYENARASFNGGLLQDARSEDEQFRSDFNSLLLLKTLSSKSNKDIGLFEESLNELEESLFTWNSDLNQSELKSEARRLASTISTVEKTKTNTITRSQCESLGKTYVWNGTINQWYCEGLDINTLATQNALDDMQLCKKT